MYEHIQVIWVWAFIYFFKNYFLPFFLNKICLDFLRPFFVNIFIFLVAVIKLIIFLFTAVYLIYILYFFNFFKNKFFHHKLVMCALLKSNTIFLLLFFFIL